MSHRPKTRWLLWLASAGLAVLVVLQFFRVERTNPPVISEIQAPPEVREILRRSCYDCHSHETRWPWYSRVAPMSWLVADHVEHARGDLNFSDWPASDPEAQEHAFEDIREEVEEGEMPLASYLAMHPRARLSDEERELLLRWAGGS
jgi:hypothetical protein